MLITAVHSLVDGGFKTLVEGLQHLCPGLVAFSNLIEVLLHLSREVIVHNAWEILHQVVVHHNADIRRHELALVRAGQLAAHFLRYLLALERIDSVHALLTFLVTLGHVLTLLDSRDGGGVGRRTANTQFLKLMHQRCLRIALRSLTEPFDGGNLATRQFRSLYQRGQHVAELVLLLVLVVARLTIDLQETVEFHNLALSDEG